MDGVVQHVDEADSGESELAGFEDVAAALAASEKIPLCPVEQHRGLLPVLRIDQIQAV